MKQVTVTVSGYAAPEVVPGVTFSVFPNEVVIYVPGSEGAVLNLPVVDNPLLNSQAYNFNLQGYDVAIEVNQWIEEVVDYSGGYDEPLSEDNGIDILNETLGEPNEEPEAPSLEDNVEENVLIAAEETIETELPVIEETFVLHGEDLASEEIFPTDEVQSENITSDFDQESPNGLFDSIPDHAEDFANVAYQKESVEELTNTVADAPEEEVADNAIFLAVKEGIETVLEETVEATNGHANGTKEIDQLKYWLHRAQELLKTTN
ncbi:hypothetical protein [Haliscomenobacter sp.]|uniref:hypothetical protein n=1 Tax=Haliscomenobacter sp. TaxID=2717303 RepID=UPI003364D3A7